MSHRDDVRAIRQQVARAAQAVGIDLDAERKRTGGNPRSFTISAQKLMNDGTPRTTREDLVVDQPVAGTYDGANTAFTLSDVTAGQNVVLIWHDNTVPRVVVMKRTNASPPANECFFFDINDPTHIIVNPAPAAADALIAVFKRA